MSPVLANTFQGLLSGTTSLMLFQLVVASKADFDDSLDRRFIVVSALLQLPVLACWVVVRPISLAAFAGCSAFAPVYR